MVDRRNHVLIVDDDRSTLELAALWLGADGFHVYKEEEAEGALKRARGVSVACVDLGLDGMSGLELIAKLRDDAPDLVIIVVTADTDLETAVRAMRAGAYDYITKPISRERLGASVRRASERFCLASEVRSLEAELKGRTLLDSIVGESSPMRRLADQVSRIVDSDVAVSIFGESGTGKELVARAIHNGGNRAKGPFVALNCAAIPETLQESELFGHEKGAFTGASAQHKGRFEQACGGTLFLDELGEMSASTQATLLRTLQERTIRRVGATREIPVDVRIVCATHRDLRKEVSAGRFREDLYYRLVVFPLTVPPLRERRDDIPLLVRHFLDRMNLHNPSSVRLTLAAMECLSAYNWPGNVRELQNVVQRALLMRDGNTIDLHDLPREIRSPGAPSFAPPGPVRSSETSEGVVPRGIVPLQQLERQAIQDAMAVAGGNVAEAATLLGIGRATLYRRLAKDGLVPQTNNSLHQRKAQSRH